MYRYLTVKDLLSGEIGDGTLGLAWGGKVDEGISDRTGGAWVGRDGGGLTVAQIY